MHDKLATVRRLMSQGYQLEDIEDGRDHLRATFHLRGHRATVRLFASDAERLLYAPRDMGRVWIRR